MAEKNKQQENEELAQATEDLKEKDSGVGKKEKSIIDSIESLSVMEMAALVKALEEKFGVSAAMPVMAAG
ncbi:MAG: 50S ribosomal protein L7/L12, partial [Candidatus Omnitrophica bacterium]|nr:50S ribosomal protein L7/L12 [Candidatus Omnitrophota bacterium]